METIHFLVEKIFEWISGLGYWGILIGLMIEIIPSEIVLGYGGYLVSEGTISFFGAVIYGTIGGVIAQLIIYCIARYGGRPFLEKYGKYLLIRRHHLNASERWFKQYGAGVIFTARFIPVVRHAISVPAGISKMPLWTFTLLTTAAVIPWTICFLYIGYKLGDHWDEIDTYIAPFMRFIIIGAIFVGAIYILFKFMKDVRRREYGKPGEQMVQQALRALGKEYHVLHGKKLAAGGSKHEFDHIVVGPNAIFHIETKYWAGEIRFTAKGVQRTAGKPSYDPSKQLQRHAYILKQLARRNKMSVDIVGVLCFTHPHGHVVGRSDHFPTLKIEELVPFIRSYRGKVTFTQLEVKRLVRMLRRN